MTEREEEEEEAKFAEAGELVMLNSCPQSREHGLSVLGPWSRLQLGNSAQEHMPKSNGRPVGPY